MFKTLVFEISGVCNARCPYCITGNRSGGTGRERFVDPARFEAALDRLLAQGLIGPRTVVHLYNWGEPFLHPDLPAILAALAKRQLRYIISTNASRPMSIPRESLPFLKHVFFSAPGLSQASYDRIHGFDMGTVHANIDAFLASLRVSEFTGKREMLFHIYQFNLDEVAAARRFCRERHILFSPYAAYLNDYNQALAYLSGKTDYALLRRISQELLLFYVDDLLAAQPANFRCQQFDQLTIGEDCRVLTCCVAPKSHPDYALGSLFDLSAEEIRTRKVSRSICKECLCSGIAWWTHNPHVPAFAQVRPGKLARVLETSRQLTLGGMLRKLAGKMK
jgi:hypothetical protein